MALDEHLLPYGLRDVKVTPIADDGSYGTFVDLPASRTLSWSEDEDFEELRGDDTVIAERGSGPTVSWDLESGGVSMDALAVLNGGTVTETGTTPNIVRTYNKKGTDSKPYFRIDGQAINDNGGDTHVVLYRCKVTGSVEGEFSDGSFLISSCSGRGYADPNNSENVWDLVANETATAIAQPA